MNPAQLYPFIQLLIYSIAHLIQLLNYSIAHLPKIQQHTNNSYTSST